MAGPVHAEGASGFGRARPSVSFCGAGRGERAQFLMVATHASATEVLPGWVSPPAVRRPRPQAISRSAGSIGANASSPTKPSPSATLPSIGSPIRTEESLSASSHPTAPRSRAWALAPASHHRTNPRRSRNHPYGGF